MTQYYNVQCAITTLLIFRHLNFESASCPVHHQQTEGKIYHT